MDREIKEITIDKDEYDDEQVICWVVPSDEELFDEDDEDDELDGQELINIPGYAFMFIYSYDGQITHFFPEDILFKDYVANIDDPAYTPVPGLWSYHGDGLDIEDQPAHVIIKEVLKKRGYI